MKTSIAGIVDYDAGNIRSLTGALDELGQAWRMLSSPLDVAELSREPQALLILPGVGAFGAAMASLEAKGLVLPLRAWLQAERPFLGICLGLQLLYEGSDEDPDVRGLGFLPGRCAKFTGGLKIPSIGWNQAKPLGDNLALFGRAQGEWFYFVHSYHPPLDSPCVAALADYGYDFPCAISKGAALAFQFHPEKSSLAGLALLRRVLGL
jgi:imidazole glycerol phosphate synthase glutamine amidotransferase subunit